VIRSMTGFGNASIESERLRASVSMRSLNHRFLDVSLQAPRSLRCLEPEVKALVQSRLSRGRVDVVLQATALDQSAEAVVASRPLVEGLVRVLREIQSHHGLEGGVQVSDIARFPGAIEVEAQPELDADQRAQVLTLVGEALDGLEAMRRTEGEALEGHLSASLAEIEAAGERVERLASEGAEARRSVLLEKVRSLCSDLGLEEPRLYQEVVRLADRHDVKEELQRLASHVEQLRGLLRSEGACGKRLDFLVQELMREANTVGSKSPTAELTHQVVGLKSEIERLREQVQNVE
jgi:uncharacterized protein (TIGR00255 family)